MLPMPAMWNSGTPMKPTSLLMSAPMVKRLVIACPARLVCVSTAPLGRPVVPEVYMISAGESLGTSDRSSARLALLGEQVVVAEQAVLGGAAGDDHGGQRRIEVAHRRRHAGEHRFGDHDAGFAVADEERHLGRRHAEVDGHRDGAEQVGGQEGLDELGAVEHQDQHAIAEADAAAAQRTRQRRHAAIELTPRGRVAEESQRGGIGLHQRVAGELVGPVVPAGQVGLLDGLRGRAGEAVNCWCSLVSPAQVAQR